jgi:tetratricopeptide (TPR) repeat protein
VHRLVQAVARTPDLSDPHRQPSAVAAAADQATHLLFEADPGDYRDPATWEPWRRLLPHVDALTHHRHPDDDTTESALLLNRAGLFAGDQGAVDRAIGYLRRALAANDRLLGTDHSDTLIYRNNLASAHRMAGDLEQAIPLYRTALTGQERALGPDHPDTLDSRHKLARAHWTAGDLARAIPLYRAVLTDCVRVLGSRHPLTRAVRHSLAEATQAD